MIVKSSCHTLTYQKSSVFNYGHKKRLSLLTSIIENLSVKRGSLFLDCGCSDGFILSEFSSITNFDNYVGLDWNSENIKRAKSNYNLDFRKVNLNEKLPFSDGSVDLLTCFETLEHVSNFIFTIDEFLRVVKKGSVVLISVPNELGFSSLLKNSGRLIRDMKNGHSLRESISKNQLSLKYLFSSFFCFSIDHFRNSSSKGYGSHMGFDYRLLISHLEDLQLSHVEIEYVPRLFRLSVILKIIK